MLELYRALRVLHGRRKSLRIAVLATAPGRFTVPLERGDSAQDRAHMFQAHVMKHGRRTAA